MEEVLKESLFQIPSMGECHVLVTVNEEKKICVKVGNLPKNEQTEANLGGKYKEIVA